MANLHTAVVLRMASVYKNAIILLDEHVGKIECTKSFREKSGQNLFHGALISCSLQKRGTRYLLSNVLLLDMPSYWVGEHFLFFHHVLELCDAFLRFDEHAEGMFALVRTLV